MFNRTSRQLSMEDQENPLQERIKRCLQSLFLCTWCSKESPKIKLRDGNHYYWFCGEQCLEHWERGPASIVEEIENDWYSADSHPERHA